MLLILRLSPAVKSWPQMRFSMAVIAVCSAGTKPANLSEKVDALTVSVAEC